MGCLWERYGCVGVGDVGCGAGRGVAVGRERAEDTELSKDGQKRVC